MGKMVEGKTHVLQRAGAIRGSPVEMNPRTPITRLSCAKRKIVIILAAIISCRIEKLDVE
jgi:hypothetical protein